jgi:hypothetical protein
MCEEKSYTEKWQDWAANATPMSEAMAAPEITPDDNKTEMVFRNADAPQPREPYYPAPY